MTSKIFPQLGPASPSGAMDAVTTRHSPRIPYGELAIPSPLPPSAYRHAFVHSGVSQLLHRGNVILDANTEFCRDVGYTHAELVGMHISQLTPEFKEPLCNLIACRLVDHRPSAQSINSNWPMMNCFRTKNGSVVFRFGHLSTLWDGVCTVVEPHEPFLPPNKRGMFTSSASSQSSSGSAFPSFISLPTGCGACGSEFSVLSVGIPTPSHDMDTLLRINLEHAVRIFDEQQWGERIHAVAPISDGRHLEIAHDFYSSGLITASTRMGESHQFVLPAAFRSAVLRFDAIARRAARTGTSPPTCPWNAYQAEQHTLTIAE